MKLLVTGAAGFIGSALVNRLLEEGHEVVGLDNINAYYDTRLKFRRLALAGIAQGDIRDYHLTTSTVNPAYRFIKLDLTERTELEQLFRTERFDAVVNLAGQAGVRYSIENPYSYVQSNVVGFLNILEGCRQHGVRHLLYASSSSVYGDGNHVPYREDEPTDAPVSLYAATKKSDELMAHAYHALYGFNAVGLRFFTVYGPDGRPDMAPSLFLHALLDGRPIRVFNHGDLSRDFTYIDDIVEGILCILRGLPADGSLCRVYNIGRSEPVRLMDFIHVLEEVSGHQAVLQMEPMQPGDVHCTYADTSALQRDFGYRPSVSLHEGIRRFYEWATAAENASRTA